MKIVVAPGGRIGGDVRVASDKSISHRAFLLAALAAGRSEIENPLTGADVRATMAAVRACGARVDDSDPRRVTVDGGDLRAPTAAIDCGNAGTLIRLFCGFAAGRDVPCELTGDESLAKRPMARIAAPLRAMGANIQTAPGGVLPVVVKRARAPLAGIRHDLPVASAQIKSAILLAALGARGETTIREPAPSRDHTERMLGAFGIDVRRAGATVSVVGGGKLRAAKIAAPADISSAMFFVVLAAIAPAAEVILREVGINSTRAGALAILRRMGARIEIENERQLGGEPVADIRVRAGARLRGVEIGADETPAAIDEFPAIFIAAACAAGETRLTGAGELRLKESDRIAAMAAGLRALQIDARPSADGIRIRGAGGAVDSRPVFAGGAVDSCGDHRVAMSFAVAAARAAAPIEIADCANVATSFPDFVAQARAVGLDARAVDSESRPLTPRPETATAATPRK